MKLTGSGLRDYLLKRAHPWESNCTSISYNLTMGTPCKLASMQQSFSNSTTATVSRAPPQKKVPISTRRKEATIVKGTTLTIGIHLLSQRYRISARFTTETVFITDYIIDYVSNRKKSSKVWFIVTGQYKFHDEFGWLMPLNPEHNSSLAATSKIVESCTQNIKEWNEAAARKAVKNWDTHILHLNTCTTVFSIYGEIKQ